jgi:hypothetical protein
MRGLPRSIALCLIALSFGCATERPKFRQFEPSRPPPRVTGEPGPLPPGRTPVPSWRDPCMDAPQTAAYFSALKEEVLSNWRASIASPQASARVTLVLRANGEVESVALTSESPSGVGASVLEAIDGARPFPPLPPEAACLAGEPLLMHFSLESLPPLL